MVTEVGFEPTPPKKMGPLIEVLAHYFLRCDSIENILYNYGLPTVLKNRILDIKETNDSVKELFSNSKRKKIN